VNSRALTLLSLVGVLAAGSAAAMVNTRVLTSETAANRTESILTLTNSATSASKGAPSTTTGKNEIADSASIPTTSVESQTRPLMAVAAAPGTIPPSESTEPAARSAAYQIGDAGLVRIEITSDRLRVAEVLPGQGWTLSGIVSGPPSDGTRVVLASSSMEMTFIAELVGGNVITRIETRSLTSLVAGGAGTDNEDDEVENDEELELDEDVHEEDDDQDEDDHDEDHEGENDDD